MSTSVAGSSLKEFARGLFSLELLPAFEAPVFLEPSLFFLDRVVVGIFILSTENIPECVNKCCILDHAAHCATGDGAPPPAQN